MYDYSPPDSATVKASRDTKTTNIGDSVTLSVSASVSDTSLRWRHNGGDIIEDWNGLRTISITNVRKADEGIYECHEDGQRDLGLHAVMRLIVRGEELYVIIEATITVQGNQRSGYRRLP